MSSSDVKSPTFHFLSCSRRRLRCQAHRQLDEAGNQVKAIAPCVRCVSHLGSRNTPPCKMRRRLAGCNEWLVHSCRRSRSSISISSGSGSGSGNGSISWAGWLLPSKAFAFSLLHAPRPNAFDPVQPHPTPMPRETQAPEDPAC